jgi:hypothetical protein
MEMLKVVTISIISSISFGALCIFLVPPMVKIYLWPGMYIGYVAAKAIPSPVIYALVPEGGGPAFLLITATSSVIFWTCTIIGAYLIKRRL